MPELFRRKDIILFILLVAMLHILLTYLVSNRVGKVLGEQTAGIISGALLDEEVSKYPYRDDTSKVEEDVKVYQNLLFFLSLPFDPIFQPIHERWAIKPILNGKIQVAEYKFRGKLIGTITMVLNSIVFSLLAYWCFRTVRQRMKQNRINKNT